MNMRLSSVNFCWITGKTALKVPVRPESPAPCPYTNMNASFFGWPLKEEEVPTKLIAEPGFRIDQMGDVRMMEWHFIISERLASVLASFDLGRSRLTQVPLVSHEDQEFDGKWFHLHISETKDTLVPLRTDGFRGINKRLGLVSGLPRPYEGAISVTETSAQGVDLWRDPMWNFGVFASDRLVKAMTEKGVGGDFEWMPARVATSSELESSVIDRMSSAMAPPEKL